MENFADLPEALQDADEVVEGLHRLQFSDEEITVMKNVGYQEIKIAIDIASADIYQNFKRGLNTLLFVYYAGHGMMNNTTYIVTNGKRMYPLESTLRCLAKADGSYVVSVFDCCREKMQQKPMRGRIEANSSSYDFEDESEWIGKPNNSQENIIITYGCQPSQGVPAKSTLATTYFQYLGKSSQPSPDGKRYLALPGCLNFFQNVDGKCEHVTKVAKPCLLEWIAIPEDVTHVGRLE